MIPNCERMVTIGNSNHIMRSIERKVVAPSAVKKVFLQHRADPRIIIPIHEFEKIHTGQTYQI
jgi:hypothetical protein